MGFCVFPIWIPTIRRRGFRYHKTNGGLFLQSGFRYLDTAYTYLNGKSEEALRLSLVERYPRQDFMIADKLPCGALRSGKKQEDIFAEQLRRCGVDFFDVYLLHGLDGEDATFADCYRVLLDKYPLAKNCISCGSCQQNCPQKLRITELMKQVSHMFSNDK